MRVPEDMRSAHKLCSQVGKPTYMYVPILVTSHTASFWLVRMSCALLHVAVLCHSCSALSVR